MVRMKGLVMVDFRELVLRDSMHGLILVEGGNIGARIQFAILVEILR